MRLENDGCVFIIKENPEWFWTDTAFLNLEEAKKYVAELNKAAGKEQWEVINFHLYKEKT